MIKATVADLAVWGGTPLFDRVRPIGQLACPNQDAFMELVDKVYETRRITNGPLVHELEDRLKCLHETEYCVAVANASLGIILLLEILTEGKRGEVIMPAFTYPGLPHLASWAGQMPRFCDIDPEKHTLSPVSVRKDITESTTAILGVHQVNSPCDIQMLDEISKETGVPVFYDSVHGVRSTYNGQEIGGFGRAEVFSLHATKLINGFEGGYITTNDKTLAEELMCRRNFGFQGEAAAVMHLGMNAKLNEIHAAMALCSMKDLNQVVTRNEERYLAYCRYFQSIEGLSFLPYPKKERSNFEFAVLEISSNWPITRDQTVDLLRAENGLCRAYYSPPLHQSPHCPENILTPKLPVTEKLSTKYIQMPVGEMVSINDIRVIAEFFKFINKNGPEIKESFEKINTGYETA